MTSYDLRISDLCSDLCSSDLLPPSQPSPLKGRGLCSNPPHPRRARFPQALQQIRQRPDARIAPIGRPPRPGIAAAQLKPAKLVLQRGEHPRMHHLPARSEEHTSELQSLMRISYAVFCLKKKKTE